MRLTTPWLKGLSPVALLLAAAPALAFNPQPDPPARLGDFSLVAGQSLRLNAHLTKPAAPSRDGTPVQCKVTLSFQSEGRAVGRSLIGLLRPGQNARLDIVGSELVGSQPLAVQPCIRVLPAVQDSTLPAVQSCAVAVTLEVLDERGRVTAVVADPRLVTPDSVEQ